MRDEINRIIARHFLILQKISRVGFAFSKDRNEDVCAGHFGAARRLYMDRSALDHPLECGRRHCF